MKITMSTKLIVAILPLLLSGCVLTAPQHVAAEWHHASFPLAGQPFGPKEEEDALDTLGLAARWEFGRVYFDAGLGHRVRDAGFSNDRNSTLVYSGKVGFKLWERD